MRAWRDALSLIDWLIALPAWTPAGAPSRDRRLAGKARIRARRA